MSDDLGSLASLLGSSSSSTSGTTSSTDTAEQLEEFEEELLDHVDPVFQQVREITARLTAPSSATPAGDESRAPPGNQRHSPENGTAAEEPTDANSDSKKLQDFRLVAEILLSEHEKHLDFVASNLPSPFPRLPMPEAFANRSVIRIHRFLQSRLGAEIESNIDSLPPASELRKVSIILKYIILLDTGESGFSPLETSLENVENDFSEKRILHLVFFQNKLQSMFAGTSVSELQRIPRVLYQRLHALASRQPVESPTMRSRTKSPVRSPVRSPTSRKRQRPPLEWKPTVGELVRRGPDWQHGSQDKDDHGGKGTVLHVLQNYAVVQWEGSEKQGRYSYGDRAEIIALEDAHDAVASSLPFNFRAEEIAVSCRVRA